MPIKIITTEDGSHSLYHEELKETYHSIRGARGESLHVFIKEGLEYWLSQNEPKEIKILEVGLGTGLNVLLTAQFAKEQGLRIRLTSLEPFPIERDIYKNLNYYRSEEEYHSLIAIHESPWESPVRINDHIDFLKIRSPLEEFNSDGSFHIIYFDAFAPGKQPEVWSLENLKKCYGLLDAGGIFTTYCAQGQFKRNLAEAGFEVETLKGAMGKKEMVRGVKRVLQIQLIRE